MYVFLLVVYCGDLLPHPILIVYYDHYIVGILMVRRGGTPQTSHCHSLLLIKPHPLR